MIYTNLGFKTLIFSQLICEATGTQWENDSLRLQVTANINGFAKAPRTVSVAMDGKRLGTPDAETLAYYIWEARHDRSLIGAPQVNIVSWKEILQCPSTDW